MKPIDTLIQKLSAQSPKRSGQNILCKCPAHDDRSASLSIKELSNGNVIMHCHAGCKTEDVLKSVGMDWKDLFIDARPHQGTQAVAIDYIYYSTKGVPLFRKRRMPNKVFSIQHTPDGGATWLNGMHPDLEGKAKPLYNQPALAAMRNTGQTVYICEGEKDAEAIILKGGFATCNFDGAAKAGQNSKWKPEYGPLFEGLHVIIVADDDEPGVNHARNIAISLRGKAASVKVVSAKAGKDAYDHFTNGYKLTDFVRRQDIEPPIGLSRRCLSTVSPKPVYWLWHERIPKGGATFLSGEGDEGKTFAVLSIAAALSNGADIPAIGLHSGGNKTKTLILAQEDTAEHVIRPRIDMLGGDPNMFYHVDKLFAFDDIGLTLLEETIAEEGIGMVIIDPLSNYYPKGVDPNSGPDVRPIIMALNQIADRTSAVILNLAHNNKATGQDIRHRIMGSADIRNAHRAGFSVMSDPENPKIKYMFHTKANWSASGRGAPLVYTIDPVSGLVWMGTAPGVTPEDLTREAKRASKGFSKAELDRATALLRSMLSRGDDNGVALMSDVFREAERESVKKDALYEAARALGLETSDENGRTAWVDPSYLVV